MKVENIQLINGSKLIVVNIPGSVSTTTMALVKSGPRYDPVDKAGLSHFIEHMLFRGSEKWPTRMALASALEKKGASDYAFTYYQTNRYWIKSSNRDIELVIESLVDRMINPILRSEDIEAEKGVVKEERGILDSNPEKLIWELWSETIWRDTPLGRSYIGDYTNIESFTKTDIQNFMEKYYVPARMMYTISGNVDSKKIEGIFNRLISDKKVTEELKQDTGEESVFQKSSDRRIRKMKVDSVNVAIGFQTVKFGHSDSHVLDLIGSILAGGMSSRLRQRIMEPGLTYSIDYHTEYLENTGYFMIMFTASKQNLRLALEMIIEEFNKLTKFDVNKDEMETAKGFLSGTLEVNVETTYDWANWYSNQLLFSPQDVESPKNRVKKMLCVKPEEIKVVAKKYFDLNNLCLSAIGDINEKDILQL